MIAEEPAVAATVTWLEGPAVDVDGVVYFTDVKGNRIMKLATDGTLSILRSPANYPNGMVFDARGRLVVCEEGDPAAGLPPRITRTDLRTGALEALVEDIGGKRLRGPNDVRVDQLGRLYFTDGARPFFLPPYSVDSATGLPPPELPDTGVYRIDVDGTVKRILAPPMIRQPNGLAISPDGRTFYLIENDIAAAGLRQLLAFDLRPDGSVSNKRVLHDFHPGRSGDGMAVDGNGNLWVAAGLNRLRGTAETLATKAGVHVFSAQGEQIGFVPIAEDTVTNVAFGRPDARTLYVTAGKTLFRMTVSAVGVSRLNQ